MIQRAKHFTITQNVAQNATVEFYHQDLPLDPATSNIQVDFGCAVNASAECDVYVHPVGVPETGAGAFDPWNLHVAGMKTSDTVVITQALVKAISIRPNAETDNGQVITGTILLWPRGL